ncbi:unnamed protein product [Ixodes persulcatus]
MKVAATRARTASQFYGSSFCACTSDSLSRRQVFLLRYQRTRFLPEMPQEPQKNGRPVNWKPPTNRGKICYLLHYCAFSSLKNENKGTLLELTQCFIKRSHQLLIRQSSRTFHK